MLLLIGDDAGSHQTEAPEVEVQGFFWVVVEATMLPSQHYLWYPRGQRSQPKGNMYW